MHRLLLVVAISGCYHPDIASGVPCSEHGICPTGFECRAGLCERPGTDASMSDGPIDGCPTSACVGSNAIDECGVERACANGCNPGVSTGGITNPTGAHCAVLVPSNGITTALLAGATADVTGNDWSFDTVTGEIRRGALILRAAGAGVKGGIGFQVVDGIGASMGMGVFTAHRFNVAASDNWSADGVNTLVLFAATSITVTGDIDVGANGTSGGPGGSNATTTMTGTSCRGRAGRYFSAGYGEGGGGGGGRTAGGNGGASNQPSPTGLGGTLCQDMPSTIPLRGGVGGAHGGNSGANGGGGGGGAVALVAMESITVTGDVGAPGAGGQSGPGPAPSGDGGGGGGGGGAVFLEAPSVTVSGALTANGGGGAAPFMVPGSRGTLGSINWAAGGSYTGPGGTVAGGHGGTGAVAPTNGGTYTESDATPVVIITRGGGGGGAAGRIEIKSVTRNTAGSTMSPGAALSAATVE